MTAIDPKRPSTSKRQIMSEQLKLSWPRILAEGTAIVASILLAFWIDAWWDHQTNRQDERILLAALRTVLADYRTDFASNISYAKVLREASRDLLNAAIETDDKDVDRQLDKRLASLLWYLGDPVSPDVSTLLTNENILQVSNRDLAYRLGVLQAKLGRYARMVEIHEDFYFNQLMPYLQANAYLPQINDYADIYPGTDDEVYPVVPIQIRQRVSHLELVKSHEFQSLLMRRIWRLTDVTDWREEAVGGVDIDVDIEEILQIIDAELAQ